MFQINDNYQKLPGSYLFSTIAKKVAAYQEASPESSTRGRYVEANAPRAKYYEKNFFECQPA